MDTDYTKRETDEYRDHVKEALTRIEEQTKKTNGRVKALELSKAYVLGSIFVLMSMVIPLIIYVWTHQVNQFIK